MALDILVDLDDLAPSDASLSRKSDHRPANDSFRPLPSKVSAISDGVLGVRCHGDIGVLRFGFDAPGLASPACSRCSAIISSYHPDRLPRTYHQTSPKELQ
jgi:hypothetical protein